MADLRGINLVMQTPFHEGGSINLMREHVLDPASGRTQQSVLP